MEPNNNNDPNDDRAETGDDDEGPIARHYIFGYGSLICQHSRSLTAGAATEASTTEASAAATTTAATTAPLPAAAAVATPVRVRGLQRVWNVRAPGFSALGVQWTPTTTANGALTHWKATAEGAVTDDGGANSSRKKGGIGSCSAPASEDYWTASSSSSSSSYCWGVLVPVRSAAELANLDARELGYQRQPIPLDDIDYYAPSCPEDEQHSSYSTHPHHSFLHKAKAQAAAGATASMSKGDDSGGDGEGDCGDDCTRTPPIPARTEEERLQIWVYVPEQHQPPQEDCPIVQSYVDTIVRGCLEYGREFAVAFLQTTQGWTTTSMPPHLQCHSHYVDDRHRPIYPRGDPVWSRQHADRVDALLREHIAESFRHRTRIG
jgi:hypothetical protein